MAGTHASFLVGLRMEACVGPCLAGSEKQSKWLVTRHAPVAESLA
jgi:hypothetical protein